MSFSQTSSNLRSYDDGVQCAKKGLGFTKSGLFDYQQRERLFGYSFRNSWGVDREECYEAWTNGFDDECDRLEALRAGYCPCGRPI